MFAEALVYVINFLSYGRDKQPDFYSYKPRGPLSGNVKKFFDLAAKRPRIAATIPLVLATAASAGAFALVAAPVWVFVTAAGAIATSGAVAYSPQGAARFRNFAVTVWSGLEDRDKKRRDGQIKNLQKARPGSVEPSADQRSGRSGDRRPNPGDDWHVPEGSDGTERNRPHNPPEPASPRVLADISNADAVLMRLESFDEGANLRYRLSNAFTNIGEDCAEFIAAITQDVASVSKHTSHPELNPEIVHKSVIVKGVLDGLADVMNFLKDRAAEEANAEKTGHSPPQGVIPGSGERWGELYRQIGMLRSGDGQFRLAEERRVDGSVLPRVDAAKAYELAVEGQSGNRGHGQGLS